jgi:hypothetical protein
LGEVRDRETRSPARETRALPSLKRAQIVGHIWVSRRERFNIADFDVNFLYAGPFCARTEEPAPLSDYTRSVESIPRNQKLHSLAGADIRANYDTLTCAILVQHKDFNGITQVPVVKLIIANAMESHRRFRRHHEIQCGTHRATVKKWCRQSAGRNSLVADKCNAHESTRGMRLELQKSANLFRCEIIAHVFFLNM